MDNFTNKQCASTNEKSPPKMFAAYNVASPKPVQPLFSEVVKSNTNTIQMDASFSRSKPCGIQSKPARPLFSHILKGNAKMGQVKSLSKSTPVIPPKPLQPLMPNSVISNSSVNTRDMNDKTMMPEKSANRSSSVVSHSYASVVSTGTTISNERSISGISKVPPPVFALDLSKSCAIREIVHLKPGVPYSVFGVPGDGDCFFHTLSLSQCGHFGMSTYYRQLICKYVFNHWSVCGPFAVLFHDLPSKTPQGYWRHMINNKGWATMCEINVASRLLNCNINTWLKCIRNGVTSYLENMSQSGYPNACTIELLNRDNHFSVVQRYTPQFMQNERDKRKHHVTVSHNNSGKKEITSSPQFTKTVKIQVKPKVNKNPDIVRSNEIDKQVQTQVTKSHPDPSQNHDKIRCSSSKKRPTSHTKLTTEKFTNNETAQNVVRDCDDQVMSDTQRVGSISNEVSRCELDHTSCNDTNNITNVDVTILNVVDELGSTHQSNYMQGCETQCENPCIIPNQGEDLTNLGEDEIENVPISQKLCRKLGAQYECSKPNESYSEKKNRKLRNKRSALRQKNKINIECTEQIPEAPPLIENEQFNKAMDAIRSFELQQMSYIFECCTVCNERRVNTDKLKNGVCKRCCKDKSQIKMFSDGSNMDPGQVPAELSNLTVVEQQLICSLSPNINIHMLKHGGIGSSGHCITFPQEINEPCKIFPKLPTDINIIRIRKQGRNDTSKEFRVRRFNVEKALIWLKLHNPAYSKIEISRERLDMLPEDGEIGDLHTVEYTSDVSHINDKGPAPEQLNCVDIDDGETNSSVLLPEVNVDIRKAVETIVHDVVGENAGDVTMSKKKILTLPWPTRDNTPASEFTTQNFFTLSFPCLFPYGKGDFNANRPVTCSSLSDWAEHLLWYKDGRFAHHKFFKFVVHNMIVRRRALEQSKFIVKQQLGDEHLTVSDLRDRLQNGDTNLGQRILYLAGNLRGTSQYWAQRSKELRSLVQFQLNEGNGLPSFFATGSCAEYHFKPLKRLLKMYVYEITGSEPDLENRSTLFSVLQENTHIVAHYFDLRTHCYFSEVMKKVFGVESFWYRQEFAKSRGMVHWHGLCWRSDRQPHNLLNEALNIGLSESDAADKLSQWAQNNFAMTASHPAGKDNNGNPRKDLWCPPEGTAPPPPENMNPLVKLMMDISDSQNSILEDHILLTNRINIHRCSDYCLRPPRNNKTGEKSCRMGFGTVENPGRPLITSPCFVQDRNNSLRLEMPRDHPMLVQHSQYHTQGWRANGDISLIIGTSDPSNPSVSDIMSVEKYICSYACKGNESTGATADLFNDMINTTDDTSGATARSLCTQLLMGTVKRDISAVEASYELSSLPLYRSSHQFQSVSLSGSRILEKNENGVTKNTALDKYLSRPQNDTNSWYSFISKFGKVPVLSGSYIRATWPLTEDYCRTMLLLHWPNWRRITDIKSGNTTWSDRFDEFLLSNSIPHFVKADVERAKSNIPNFHETDSDEGEQNDAQNVERPEWMDLIQPNVVYDDFVSDFAYDDGGDDFNWGETSNTYPSDLGTHFIENMQTNPTVPNNELIIPDINVESMNSDQRFAFNLIMNALLKYKNGASDYEPLRVIVAGTAGSGKSHLIKCLVKTIRSLFKTNKSVQVLCPTGNSANLISGVTLRSFLKVPTSNSKLKEMSPPDGTLGESLQNNLDGVEVLLIDERSMIGCTTLGWMEYLCRCGLEKGINASKSWGGIPVVAFFGDDAQLPPVCDSPVYNCKNKSTAAIHGAMVWKEFSKAVTLQTIIRQNNDQKTLKDVLMAMRQYQITSEQAKWLQNFEWNNLKNNKQYGDDLCKRMQENGLFVFPSHADEWSHNKSKLLETNKSHPIAKIDAKTEGIHANKVSSDKAGGLIRTLYICKGAKVMLTCNINVQYGLFNGAMGEIKDIIYLNGRTPKESLPDVVMVKFHQYTGPAFVLNDPKIIPIVPITRRLDCACFGCKRTQIPLRLGWGTTIHRCQGMTIGNGETNRYIIINPGTKHFESRNPGALFVALSRAKCAGNETTDPDFAWHPDILVNEDRLCFVVNTQSMKLRNNEMKRIANLTQQTKIEYDTLSSEKAMTNIIEQCFG